MIEQVIAVPALQALPVELSGNDGLAIERRLRLLVRHLEKQQKRDLLGVPHVRQAVVPEHMGEVPGLGDNLLGGITHWVLTAAPFS